jgi:hypothetical protein
MACQPAAGFLRGDVSLALRLALAEEFQELLGVVAALRRNPFFSIASVSL